MARKKRKRGMSKGKGKTRGRAKQKIFPLSATKKAWVVARDGRGHLTGIQPISVSEAKELLG